MNGTSWGCPASSTPPGGLAPCTQPSAIPDPGGVNTAVFPWVAAGADGIADVVFYGSLAPTASDFGNAADVWNVYLAQTTDRGRTWSVSTASDHAIHTGGICMGGIGCAAGRTLLDFFQVSIDATNGAADIAYTDDHASPGNSVMYFTRQCTGTSATTGQALVDDCVVPPPPPRCRPAPTCPGPQVADFVGDAPNNYPTGDGSNMDNLDVANASFATPDATHLRVKLALNDLEPSPPAREHARRALHRVLGLQRHDVLRPGRRERCRACRASPVHVLRRHVGRQQLEPRQRRTHRCRDERTERDDRRHGRPCGRRQSTERGQADEAVVGHPRRSRRSGQRALLYGRRRQRT